ncbi:MAG TPA: amino acid permease [Sphingopyxis sp.]|nr:amino acid permease [Sphingopyxis sp.]HMP44020.1 amino acid permease [Sphingopyxis sp.]HMQ18795.1 amino acid permease [Sphingopyxis sp.]
MTGRLTDGKVPGGKLGLAMCIALVMGNMIGSGVFLLPTDLAPLGWNAVIGWIVSIAGTICLALVFARLARFLPGGCGAYTYAAEAFGPATGFIVAWSFWISCWTVNAVLAVAAVRNLAILYPALGGGGPAAALLAIAFVWIFTFVNLLGVRKAGGVQVVTLVLKLLLLLGAIAIALWWFAAGEGPAPSMQGSAPVSAAGIGQAATLTLFALLGFESALAAGDRIADPERTVPRATMIGMIATGLLYLFACTAVTMLLPLGLVTESIAPFPTFFAYFIGPEAGSAAAVLAAVAALGALNGFVLLAGELPRDLAHRGLLAPVFGTENRQGAPTWSLLLSAVLATLIVYANYERGLAGLFNFMMLVTTSTAIIFYLVGAFAAAKLERDGRLPRSPGFILLIVAGIFYVCWAFYGAGLEPTLYSLAMTLAGLPLFLLARRSAAAAR